MQFFKWMRLSILILIIVLSACSAFAPAAPATPASVPTITRTRIPTRTPTATETSGTPVAMTTFLPTWTPTSETLSTPTLTPTPMPTPTLLGDCAEIWQSGYYVMTANFKTKIKRFDCMIVQASDVVIDCDGHIIEGLDRQGHGFWIRRYGFPILQTPNNIEIRNCRVANARDGVFAEAGTNLYIHDNNFSDNFDDVDKKRFGIFLGMTEGGGIHLNQVQGARIENNIVNNAAIGIDLRDSENIVLRNNTAASNSAWGISLLNTSNSEISNNTIKDNVRWCTWGDGKTLGRGCDAAAIILQDGASNNVIENNTITGENANGVFVKAHGSRCGDNNLIQDNKIIDAIYNAVEFSFCKGNQVIGNEISGSYDAVWFGFSSNTEIRGNTIRNMRNHGIISYNSRDSIVADNQITNSREGVYFYWQLWDPKQFSFLPESPDQYASRNNVIENNILIDNAVAGIHLSESIENRIVDNTFKNNAKTIWVEGKSDGNVIANR